MFTDIPFPELQRESFACDLHPQIIHPLPPTPPRHPAAAFLCSKGRKKASWTGGRRAAFWGGAKEHVAGVALEWEGN